MFYFPRSWWKILHNEQCFGFVIGLCFSSVKTFPISKCEVQKNEHPTKVVWTDFGRNKILAYFRNKKWSWSQVYDKNSEVRGPGHINLELRIPICSRAHSIGLEGLTLATVMGDSKKKDVRLRMLKFQEIVFDALEQRRIPLL